MSSRVCAVVFGEHIRFFETCEHKVGDTMKQLIEKMLNISQWVATWQFVSLQLTVFMTGEEREYKHPSGDVSPDLRQLDLTYIF